MAARSFCVSIHLSGDIIRRYLLRARISVRVSSLSNFCGQKAAFARIGFPSLSIGGGRFRHRF